MGNRMLELLNARELQAFVLTIPYSFAIVQGIVEGTIEWTEAPDFGYEVATSVQRRQYREWTTLRSCNPAGSTPGRAGRTSTTPWRPG